MSKLFDYLKFGFDIRADETELQEIRDIVLEEAGFKWIPVSERLPEESDVYVVTATNNDFVLVMAIRYNAQYKCWETLLNVIAWMQRPKPYDPQP